MSWMCFDGWEFKSQQRAQQLYTDIFQVPVPEDIFVTGSFSCATQVTCWDTETAHFNSTVLGLIIHFTYTPFVKYTTTRFEKDTSY